MGVKAKNILSLFVLGVAVAALFTFLNEVQKPFTQEAIPVAVTYTDGRVGTLVRLEGSVGRVRGMKSAPLSVGSGILLEDIILTGVKGRGQINLIDGTQITLGNDAQFVVDEYLFDQETTQESLARFTIMRGGFSYLSGKLGKVKNPDVEIATSYGYIGIRGTSLWAGVFNNEMRVFLEGGNIVVFNEYGSVDLGAGEGTKIKGFQKAPDIPMVWKQDGIDLIKNLVAF